MRTILIVALSVLALIIIIGILIIISQFYYLSYYNNNPIKAKIAILTLENRDVGYIDIHNKSLLRYCQKHDYDYIFKESYDSDLPIYWHKMLMIRDYLKYYDYVMWLDSDTIICNYDIRIESILNQKYDVYIGRDHPAIVSNIYCAGIFMIKNSDIGRAYINDCIELYLNDDYCKTDGKPSLNGKYAGRCYEQGVINYMSKTKYRKNTLSMPDRIFRNIALEGDKCFILHFYNPDRSKTSEYFKHLFEKNQ